MQSFVEYGQQVWMPQALASVPPAAPEPLATQQAALVVPGQQQQQQLQQQPPPAIIEEQQAPALESAGLPPQDGKCGNEILTWLLTTIHMQTSHIIFYYCCHGYAPLTKKTCT